MLKYSHTSAAQRYKTLPAGSAKRPLIGFLVQHSQQHLSAIKLVLNSRISRERENRSVNEFPSIPISMFSFIEYSFRISLHLLTWISQCAFPRIHSAISTVWSPSLVVTARAHGNLMLLLCVSQTGTR